MIYNKRNCVFNHGSNLTLICLNGLTFKIPYCIALKAYIKICYNISNGIFSFSE